MSDSFKKNHIANRIVVTEFGTKAIPDPCQSIFSRQANIYKTQIIKYIFFIIKFSIELLLYLNLEKAFPTTL